MLLTLPVLLLWFILPRVSIPESDEKGSQGHDEWVEAQSSHFEVYHDAKPIREGDGKVYEGVGLDVALISLPGQIHQGRQKVS